MRSLDSLNYSPFSISSSNFARRGKGFSMMVKTSSLAWWCKFVAPNRCKCWPNIRKEELQPADSSQNAAIERLRGISPDLSKCAAVWSGLWKAVIVSQSAGVDWGRQGGIFPMATHVGYNHKIAVANKERWHHAGGLWWKTLVDGRKPVQDKVNRRVHPLTVLLNHGYLRRIQLGHSGWERLNGEAHRKCDSSSGTYLTSSPHSTLVHSAWRSCGIGDSWPGYASIDVGCRDLYWEGTAYDRRCLPEVYI